jgi:hypothetical protein
MVGLYLQGLPRTIKHFCSKQIKMGTGIMTMPDSDRMSEPINWKEILPILAVFILLALFVVLSVYPQTNLTYNQKSCILGGGN